MSTLTTNDTSGLVIHSGTNPFPSISGNTWITDTSTTVPNITTIPNSGGTGDILWKDGFDWGRL